MKICPKHWDMLCAAVKDRGIDHLSAKSGKEAVDNAVSELSAEDAPYDPLMDCHYMIWSRGLEMGGLYLMGAKEDGSEYCPICEALDHMAPSRGMTKGEQERCWIDGPADAALAECRERGLAPEKQ